MLYGVKTKILAAVLFPLIVALGLMFNMIFDKYIESREMVQQAELTEFVVNVGNMLHELQKERGDSGVFLSSKGQRFENELKNQRAVTDRQMILFRQSLSALNFSAYGSGLGRLAEEIRSKLSTIDGIRHSVVSFELKPVESLKAYTAVNDMLLSSVAAVAAYGTNIRLIKSRSAYFNFIKGKELAGLERAVLAGAFVQNGFSHGAYRQFNSLLEKQETYFNAFKQQASFEQLKKYNDYLTHSVVADVQKLRDIAHIKGVAGPKAALIAELKEYFGYGGVIHFFKNFVLKGNESDRVLFFKQRDAIIAVLDEFDSLKSNSEKEKNQLVDIRNVVVEYSRAIERVRLMLNEGFNPAEVDADIQIDDSRALLAIASLTKNAKPGHFGVDGAHWFQLATVKINLMWEIEKSIEKEIASYTNELKKSAQTTFSTLLALAFTMTALTVLTAYRVIQSIIAPLQRAVDLAENIASGDLTGQISCGNRDEIGLLSNALNSMASKLKDMMQGVEVTTQTLMQAAGDMSGISSQTNEGVLQQQSELQGASTAMIEMNETVRQVADNAERAKTITHEANEEARNGRATVEATTASIELLAGEIDQASCVIKKLEDETANIGSVLDVIGSIADQTNLLALNAAIEAARAGEHGRGFAVVADEVRTLASRTQDATLEIQKMIEKLQQDASEAVDVMAHGRETAEQSVERATKARDSLETIATAVATAAQVNDAIALSSEQQLAVSHEIDTNIVSINSVADKTAMGASQTDVASAELSKLAGTLQQALSRFTV